MTAIVALWNYKFYMDHFFYMDFDNIQFYITFIYLAIYFVVVITTQLLAKKYYNWAFKEYLK